MHQNMTFADMENDEYVRIAFTKIILKIAVEFF